MAVEYNDNNTKFKNPLTNRWILVESSSHEALCRKIAKGQFSQDIKNRIAPCRVLSKRGRKQGYRKNAPRVPRRAPPPIPGRIPPKPNFAPPPIPGRIPPKPNLAPPPIPRRIPPKQTVLTPQIPKLKKIKIRRPIRSAFGEGNEMKMAVSRDTVPLAKFSTMTPLAPPIPVVKKLSIRDRMSSANPSVATIKKRTDNQIAIANSKNKKLFSSQNMLYNPFS